MNAATPQEQTTKPATPPTAARSARKPKRPVSKPAKRTGLSGLDAAAKVLAESRKPMRVAEIVERIFARRLWASDGKTPGATLNAAMLREIGAKKSASRFRKAGRGLFAAGKGR